MILHINSGGITVKEIVERLRTLETHQLEKVIDIANTIIELNKHLEDVEEGRITKLKHGKKQPIVMLDSDDQIVHTFTGFNKCSAYLKQELGVKNEQNKLRKAINEGTAIEGYKFILQPRH